MILKLIGLVILVLLGLILSVLLLVLLVPVRYFLSVSYKDNMKGTGTITWLFHAVSVKAVYENELNIIVRLLGKKMLETSESPKGAEDKLWEDMEDPTGEDRNEEEYFHEDLAEEGTDVGWIESQDYREDLPETGTDERKAGYQEDSKRRKQKEKKEKKEKKENSPSLKERLISLVQSLKEKWHKAVEYKEKAEAFLKNAENQKTISLIIGQCRALIRHILPRKLKVRAVFGFDDPSVTGKLLAGFGVLYAWYGDSIEITPMFDQKILDVEGSLKGRVRAGTLLALVIRVLLNKNFRLLVRRWRRNGGI